MSTLLVVDDAPGHIRLLDRLLAPDGHTVLHATDGVEAVRVVRHEHPDLVLMDVNMPRADGFQACRAIEQDRSARLTPVVLVTALADTASRIAGVEAGADDFVSKPFDPNELRVRVRSLLHVKTYTDDLDSAESVLVTLASTIEAREYTTGGHCQRLARYARATGRALGLNDDDLPTLERGSFLHDVGKVGIPDALLLKPGRSRPRSTT